MGCRTRQSADGDKEWQDISTWKTVSVADLQASPEKFAEFECYVYTVKTTRTSKYSICHLGSGPNLEGRLATLCTCKHSMRVGRSHEKWRDTWVVGLTSRARDKGFDGRHYLFYMMRVGGVFHTHKELFDYLAANYPVAVAAKRADNNRLGDLFCPRRAHHTTSGDPYWLNPSMYTLPVANHSHRKGWHSDISHNISGGFRSTPLLLGDPENTFVWNTPTIRYGDVLNTGCKKFHSLGDFFRFGVER